MKEADKLMVQLELLSSLISKTKGYGTNDANLTVGAFKEILRESLFEVENKIVNLDR